MHYTIYLKLGAQRIVDSEYNDFIFDLAVLNNGFFNIFKMPLEKESPILKNMYVEIYDTTRLSEISQFKPLSADETGMNCMLIKSKL